MFTLGEVAEHFRMASLRCEGELSVIVATVVDTAAVLAKGYIGKPQEEWEPLHAATIEGFQHPTAGWIVGKADLGFTGPDYQPLLRSGQMGDSIESSTEELIGVVGSTDKVALYQEMGTALAEFPVPPRPFLAKGLMESVGMVEELAGMLAVSLLMPTK